MLAKPGRKAQPGTWFVFGEGLLEAQVLEILEDGKIGSFSLSGEFYALLEQIGQMPLPPYITEKLENQERYQTVYSKELGSAAAPTASLHLHGTHEEAGRKGRSFGYVTLHVGLGTFRPVSKKVKNISCTLNIMKCQKTADLILETKKQRVDG